MALNLAHANGGVLIFNTERILIFYDGVEMSFDMDGNLPHFKGNKKGRVYLTTHRVIFNNSSKKDALQSFSMPFYCMKKVELEQPVFGANYIKGKVNAESGGNWEGSGKWKMWFNKGGAIEFGQAMLHAGRLASRYAAAQPPVYTAAPINNYYQAPPPAYSPPQGQVYAFIPYQTFPEPPPANGVFMADAPPPYPGIDPNLQAYPPAPAGAYATAPPPQANGYTPAGAVPPTGQPMSSADAKAAEAAATAAYYNPAQPSTVYMPQQAPYPPPQGAPYPPPQGAPYPPPQGAPYPPQTTPYPPPTSQATAQYPTDAPPAYDELQKKTQ